MIPARQSTARTFIVGPVLDADGVAVTDCVIADFKLSVNGGAPAAFNGSATLTHRHTGFYSLAATATDLGTVGTAQVTIDDTVNACPMLNISVIEEAVYDAIFAASANAWSGAAGSSIGVANVTQLGGDAQSLTDLKDFADAGYDPSTNKVTGVVLVDALTTYTGNTPQTGDTYAIVNSGTHGNAALKSLIDAVDNFVDTEIGAIITTLGTPSDFGSGTSTIAANLQDMADNGTATFDRSTDSLQAIRDRGDAAWVTASPPSAASIADAVWDESRLAHADTGTFGERLNDLTKEVIADCVWDEAASEHVTAGSFGKLAADILVDTGTDIPAAIADVPTVAEFNARTLAAADYFDPATDTVASVTTVGSVTTKTGYALTSAYDLYHADINLSVDEANTQDEYTVTWFKNGARITSGVTSPTIQVVKRADGTDLVASTSLTEIGSTESFKYDEDTNRITGGEAVLVIVAATIDAGSRAFSKLISRDSTA